MAAMAVPWRSRIIGEGEEAPEQLLANPLNPRIHPKYQQDALAGVLSEVGWVQRVIVNQQTGHVVDGHARIGLAISRGEPTVPVVYVDLAPDEEAKVLATLDPLGAMAGTDRDVLEQLLAEVQTDDAAVQAVLDGLSAKNGLLAPDDPQAEWQGMPAYEREPLAARTIHVHFKTEEAAQDFGRLLDQPITEATRFLWHPAEAKRDLQSVAYAAADDES